MANKKKAKNQPWRNDWVCILYYKGEVRKTFAKSQNHMLVRMPEAVHRKWGFWCNMNTKSQVPVGEDYWEGHAICSNGERVNWELYYRGNKVQEAAKLLGQIGGQNGVGKKKVRGDSNYYKMLQLKGALKRQKQKKAS